jgi:hypothetical protein
MSSLLRLVSIGCSLVLLASFAMFASDQAGTSSKQTVAKIGDGDSAPVAAPARETPKERHGAFRRAVDGANEKLVGPFKGIIATDSPWPTHIFQTGLAFLVFGVGIGFLARYAATRGV